MLNRPRRIVVVSSSRADAAHLISPLRALASRRSIALSLMQCGAALSEEYGRSCDLLRDEAHRLDIPTCDVGVPLGIDTGAEFGAAIGAMTTAFAIALESASPDLILIIADRGEMMAPAMAATTLRIPIIHIEGGERSEGALDDAVRNALTKLSHAHLVTTSLAARRVEAMGESPWRIHVVGAASLDQLRAAALPSIESVLEPIGLTPSIPLVIVSMHPTTLDDDPTAEARALLDAVDHCDSLHSHQILFAFPNADEGGRVIRHLFSHWCKARSPSLPSAKLVTQLPPQSWFTVLNHHATCAIVGNSSSVVMESPAVGIPAVLVGRRQEGREVGDNTIAVAAERSAIIAAISTALSTQRRPLWATSNPYGDGHAGERIAQAIESLPSRAVLLHKIATEVSVVDASSAAHPRARSHN